MRQLRNQVVHEYVKDLTVLASALQTGYAFVPALVAATNILMAEIDWRRWQSKKVSDLISPKILKRLENEPEISQRELAKELGISLGWVNYCLKVLIEKGWVKANNFRNSRHNKNYIYLLMPRGVKEKSRITVDFLKTKIAEYEALKHEVEYLQRETAQIQAAKRGLTG